MGITDEVMSSGIYPKDQIFLSKIKNMWDERGHEVIVGTVGVGACRGRKYGKRPNSGKMNDADTFKFP